MDHVSRVGLFLEVVKHHSFSGAARSLGMTGPALSKQVAALEDQLGVRLLHRTTRQVTLTEEGAIYNERARKALEDLSEAEQQIQELKACPTGVLRVSAPMSFGIQHLTQPITMFAKEYPNVKMEVDFDDRKADLIGEGYDIGVRIGVLEDSTLIARKLADCPILLCASPAYISTYGMPKYPEQLIDYPAIIYSKHGNIAEWRYKDKNAKINSVNLNKHFAANNAEMILASCLQGLGLASLPIFAIATHLQSGRLVHVLPEYSIYPEKAIYIVFPQNRYLSTRVRLFVDWLMERSKDLPW